MAKTFITSDGSTIQLGRELGRGGEGSVYELSPSSPFVAKIYHNSPDRKKQDKLVHMANTSSAKLLKYVAWPQAVIKEQKNGPVVGYLMPKVLKRAPIQMLYSPAHRRQDHPNTAWDFLVFIARNVAAAFEVLHSNSHILGDVNQGNIMVGADSTVILIDSDSFQINSGSAIHYCEVGVSHFTPPELQGISSFSGFHRTENHDNFGLALLIFHTLFGGRHPYSGVPLKSGVGDALETDIKEFRYAYARDAKLRGIAAPPKSIPLSILPENIEQMFHAAFTESGSNGHRPTAHQWVAALDQLRTKLKRCNASKMHLFAEHLTQCPWCVLEGQGVIYFLDLGTVLVSGANRFDIIRVWAAIETIPAPAPVHAPSIDHTSLSGRPLPASIATDSSGVVMRIIALVIGILLVAIAPALWIASLLIIWFGWNLGSSGENKELTSEITARKRAKDNAQSTVNQLLQQARATIGPEGFLTKKNSLAKLRDDYKALAEYERNEIASLQSTAQQRQKHQFLEKFFIDSAIIPGVGPGRKTTLRSFGIETAADVDKRSVMQVKGFGESLTSAMMDWKSSCERRFTFNPQLAVTAADKNTVRAKYLAKAMQLEKAIAAGSSELRAFSLAAATRSTTVLPQLHAAAKQLAQLEADLLLAQTKK
jgi:DNA-binding helix-hairpin-helix protein with protein kinase domain